MTWLADSSEFEPAVPTDSYFGNRAHSFSVSGQYNALTIVTRSLVERIATPERRYAEIPFEEFLAQDALRANTFYKFLNSTRYIPFSERLRKFFWMAARPKPREDVAEYVMRVVTYVRDQFENETSRTPRPFEPERHPQIGRRRLSGLRAPSHRPAAPGRSARALRFQITLRLHAHTAPART